jgi:hypothetical protein
MALDPTLDLLSSWRLIQRWICCHHVMALDPTLDLLCCQAQALLFCILTEI